MKRILALDYDGVIADSQMECLFSTFNSYLELNPSTCLFGSLFFTPSNFNSQLERYRVLVDKYKSLKPYLKSLVDYYYLFYSMDNGIKIRSQKDFDSLKGLSFDKDVFCANCYLEKQDKSNRAFFEKIVFSFINTGEIDFLKNSFDVIISSNNRNDFIRDFLGRYNIDIKYIIDKSLSTNKVEHMKKIKNDFSASFSEIYFIDDQVSHFPDLLDMGINCFLADWGYNNFQQQQYARKLGARVISLEEFRRLDLFCAKN